MKTRASGVLLHVTSLPSKYGIGDFGPCAYRFADFLAQAGQSYWQVLPLNPPALSKHQSPYDCLSAFAGNTLLISPELLYQHGFVSRKDMEATAGFPEGKVDYDRVASYKAKLFDMAYQRFKTLQTDSAYETFCSQNSGWLEDYACFVALSQHFRSSLWCDWPAQFRDKKLRAMRSASRQLRNAIDKEKFLQYLFLRQWLALKHYCNDNGIQIIGDVPMYAAYASADVWAHPTFFKLTRAKKPRVVAGVPPDLFSRTGQRWGNPLYNWKMLRKAGYSWWVQRIRHNLTLFDVLRIDHFRGFVACWEVPASHKTAKAGKWVSGPKEDFLNVLFKHFAFPPIIVEDLGYITDDVRQVIDRFQLPCMKVLLFAFDGDAGKSPYLPHHHIRNSVVYTGTHDNNTARGWFEKEARPEQKKRLFDYLGRQVPAGQVHWELIRLAMSSVSNTVIIPMQDILGLGREARMNRPATMKGNWRWRLRPGQITKSVTQKLAKMTQTYGRM
jgi:4-alpha-glucanotransferase